MTFAVIHPSQTTGEQVRSYHSVHVWDVRKQGTTAKATPTRQRKWRGTEQKPATLFNNLASVLTQGGFMSACIEHTQRGTQKGYGRTYYRGQKIYLHQLAFLKANGYLPEVVRHTCDNPRCINPEHLIAGTPKDNSRDMLQRRRQHKHICKLSHEDVKAIRASNKSASELAAIYGVHYTTVRSIQTGKSHQYLS